MVIHLGAPLPAPSSNQPGSTDGPPLTLPYLVLLLVGFTWHPTSPPNPVSSYLTLSPLPPFRLRRGYGGPCRQGCGGRTSLCGTIPGVAPAGRYPAPCPVEPGLSSLHLRTRLRWTAAIWSAPAKIFLPFNVLRSTFAGFSPSIIPWVTAPRLPRRTGDRSMSNAER